MKPPFLKSRKLRPKAKVTNTKEKRSETRSEIRTGYIVFDGKHQKVVYYLSTKCPLLLKGVDTEKPEYPYDARSETYIPERIFPTLWELCNDQVRQLQGSINDLLSQIARMRKERVRWEHLKNKHA